MENIYQFSVILTINLLIILLTLQTGPVGSNSSGSDSRSKSMVGFCESEFYIPKSKASCPHGITFGKRSPKCVCIKGIYRLYFSNCEMADGFAEEVCTLLNDTAFDNRVVAIKLTKEPNWDKTGVAFNRLVGGNAEWDYISEGSKARLTGSTFYTINGEAMISYSEHKTKPRKSNICIQKASLTNVICYYRHSDNVDKWHIEPSSDVIVRPTCPTDYKPMVKKRCFNPLTLLDSDCQVPCLKSNLMTGDGDINDGLYDGIPNLEGNCTDPLAFFAHENKFIDRQLLMYMVIEQMSLSNVTIPEPKSDGIIKAFQIYDQVYDIATRSCTHPYLRIDVLQLSSKFFQYLHRANKLQYDIKLSDDDFNWIQTILSQCQANMTQYKLSAEGTGECPGLSQMAQGYCHPNATAICDFRPVRISPLYANYKKKHYVPEFIWLFLDIVHMNCFDYFKDAYRMFHTMEQVYEQIFTTPIRDYWHQPTWNDGIKFSMLTVLADIVMWNTQICAESIYSHRDHKLHRLARPSQFHYPMRKKRAAEQISVGYNIGCAKNKNDIKIEGCTEKKTNPSKGKNPALASAGGKGSKSKLDN